MMLLTLSYSETIFPAYEVAKIGELVTDAFLDWNDAYDKGVMISNVTMKLIEFPDGYTLIGGKVAAGIWLECKMPSFLLAARSQKDGFFEDAASILLHFGRGRVKRCQIHTNVVHSVDGMWCLDGHRLTDKEVEAAISKEAHKPRHLRNLISNRSLFGSKTTKKPLPNRQDAISHPFYYL